MKKVFAALFVFAIIALLLTGCRQLKPQTAVINDFVIDDFTGVGSAKMATESMSKTIAETRARTSIVRQISSKVQVILEEYNTPNTGKSVDSSTRENIIQRFSQMELSGSQVVKNWQDDDGVWWCEVLYKKSDAINTISGILKDHEIQGISLK